ncbi:hypothetical protein TRSC58_01644 [Trypanosoma rangeli SC58]|uniref:Ubiquitin-like domain-containing protein n=1 Tax=Trypanosoma rangeli SC58 TaxID=429131 RepID=A0A061J8H8_TRYRA|nr:hypothetical protein TRSC58_01644 [Trypanosoma rangeli SC58]
MCVDCCCCWVSAEVMRLRGANLSSASPPVEHHSTLRIRNPDSGVVYHLVFEGNLRKLTGAQLRLHLEGICLIPAEQQRLTFNGIPVENTSTGASLGLHDRALLELHIAGAARQVPPLQSGGRSDVRRGERYAHSAEEHLNHSERSEQPRGPNKSATTVLQRTPTPSAMRSKIEYVNDNVRHPQQSYAYGGNDYRGTRPAKGVHSAALFERVLPANTLEPMDIDVEEDAIDSLSIAMKPLHGADLEDIRLEQREYVWMMEQMRFETERMNRERELLRQRQELEHEAEVLEREQCILGRHTLQERRKLAELRQWVSEELEMEARLLNIRDGGHNCSSRDNYDDASIDLVDQESLQR